MVVLSLSLSLCGGVESWRGGLTFGHGEEESSFEADESVSEVRTELSVGIDSLVNEIHGDQLRWRGVRRDGLASCDRY